VVGGGNQIVAAHFVGSDRQTNLTVIQLDSPLGSPVALVGGRPPDGALIMLLSPNGDSGHLSIWTGGQQDRGLLITTAGNVGGFVRLGQYLSGDAMKPIASELIQYGKVRRAALGVLISQAETPAGQRAMRIEQVIQNSAAAAAGLREGDFILSLAGSSVGDVPSFAAAIAERNGQTDLEILRDGQPVTVTVNLKPQ
jgi:membrane-associated protease RseP (regulator of RpoE activity)